MPRMPDIHSGLKHETDRKLSKYGLGLAIIIISLIILVACLTPMLLWGFNSVTFDEELSRWTMMIPTALTVLGVLGLYFGLSKYNNTSDSDRKTQFGEFMKKTYDNQTNSNYAPAKRSEYDSLVSEREGEATGYSNIPIQLVKLPPPITTNE